MGGGGGASAKDAFVAQHCAATSPTLCPLPGAQRLQLRWRAGAANGSCKAPNRNPWQEPHTHTPHTHAPRHAAGTYKTTTAARARSCFRHTDSRRRAFPLVRSACDDAACTLSPAARPSPSSRTTSVRSDVISLWQEGRAAEGAQPCVWTKGGRHNGEGCRGRQHSARSRERAAQSPPAAPGSGAPQRRWGHSGAGRTGPAPPPQTRQRRDPQPHPPQRSPPPPTC
jgi:hypothetical protein